MYRPLILTLAMAPLPAVLSAQVAFTAAELSASATGIVATGVGEVRVQPTRAVVYFTVETSAESSVLAASENAVRRKSVLDTLTAMGYQAAEVPTYAYAVGPAAEVPMRGPGPATERFTGRAGLQVTVSPLGKLEEVVHAILWVGATQVQYVAFEADDPDARGRALESAVIQAQRDAEAMARAAGGRLGPLLQLSTFPDFTGWNTSRAMMLERAMSMRGPMLVPSMWALLSSAFVLEDTPPCRAVPHPSVFLVLSPPRRRAGRFEQRADAQVRERPSIRGGSASPPPRTSSRMRQTAPVKPSRETPSNDRFAPRTRQQPRAPRCQRASACPSAP